MGCGKNSTLVVATDSYLLLPVIRSGTASTAPVARRTLYIEGQRGQFSIFIIIILANFIISQLLQLCRKGHFRSSYLTTHCIEIAAL